MGGLLMLDIFYTVFDLLLFIGVLGVVYYFGRLAWWYAEKMRKGK